MYLRGLSGALDHDEVRELIEAERFARKRGKPLTTTVTIHPKLLDTYPADLGRWTSWLTNKIRIWCERDRGFGYFALWVRESYEGDRREHLHMMLHLPENEREAFEAALRRWLPGKENVVDLGRPKFSNTRFGRVNKALTYMLKQMTPQAWFALNKRVRREKQCRTTHEAVAPVLGKRSGVSRTLNAKTRATFWDTPQRKPSRIAPAALPQVSAASL